MSQEQTGKMEALLKDLGRKIDELVERSMKGTEDFKINIDARKEELKRNMETLETETKNFIRNDEKWKEVEVKLKNVAHELKEAVETAFSIKKD